MDATLQAPLMGAVGLALLLPLAFTRSAGAAQPQPAALLRRAAPVHVAHSAAVVSVPRRGVHTVGGSARRAAAQARRPLTAYAGAGARPALASGLRLGRALCVRPHDNPPRPRGP